MFHMVKGVNLLNIVELCLNCIKTWKVTSMKNDGSMTSQLLKMDDSKSGETRIDELTSGKEIKRQLIRAMKEVSTAASPISILFNI